MLPGWIGSAKERALDATPPGNRGAVMLPWFEAEIVPRVNRPGIHRFDLDPSDAAANSRAVVEAQLMSMRIHSQWMKVRPKRICATGGASTDSAILQIMADVFDCPVVRIEVAKSAALGAALRASHGWLAYSGKKPRWQERKFQLSPDPLPDSEVRPRATSARAYDRLMEKYATREREAMREE